MTRYLTFVAVALLGVPAITAQAQSKPPPAAPAGGYVMPAESRPCRNCEGGPGMLFKGWTLAGSAPNDYAVGYEANGFLNAEQVNAVLASRPDANGSGFGTVMQTISARDYRGQRVRFSAQLRPRGVDEGAGLWFRVDGADGKVLAFDNMQSRPVLGTQDWKVYDVVVDVPEQGERIAYGVLLIGKGRLGVDDLRFDTVDKDVATTDGGGIPRAPVNLELKQ